MDVEKFKDLPDETEIVGLPAGPVLLLRDEVEESDGPLLFALRHGFALWADRNEAVLADIGGEAPVVGFGRTAIAVKTKHDWQSVALAAARREFDEHLSDVPVGLDQLDHIVARLEYD